MGKIANRNFLLLVTLFVVCAYGIYMGTQYIRVQKAKAMIRNAGYPVTLEELNAYYSYVPDQENAAIIYQKAFDNYQDNIRGEKAFLKACDTVAIWDDLKDKNDIAFYLNSHKKALALLRKATTHKLCRFPIDLTNGATTRLPHLSPLRQGARLLSMDAILAESQGDEKRAIEDIHAILKIGLHIRNEPTLISFLVHVACSTIGLKSLNNLLEHDKLPEKELMAFDKELRNLDSKSGLLSGFIGETCFISAAADGTTEDLIDYIASNANSTNTGSGKYLAKYNSFTINCLKLVGIHANERIRWAEWRKAYLDTIKNNDYPDVIDTLATMDNARKNSPDSAYILKSYYYISCASYSLGKLLTQIRLSQCAIAIERYKMKTKHLPDTLSQLVPNFLQSVPIDPFRNNGLLLRVFGSNVTKINGIQYLKFDHKHPHELLKKEGDYLLYGVGSDRTDNFATFDMEHPFTQGTDIVLGISKPSERPASLK